MIELMLSAEQSSIKNLEKLTAYWDSSSVKSEFITLVSKILTNPKEDA